MNTLQQAADRAAKAGLVNSETSAHLVPAAPPEKPAQQSAAEKAWKLLDDYVQILPVQFISRFERIVTDHLGARVK